MSKGYIHEKEKLRKKIFFFISINLNFSTTVLECLAEGEGGRV